MKEFVKIGQHSAKLRERVECPVLHSRGSCINRAKLHHDGFFSIKYESLFDKIQVITVFVHAYAKDITLKFTQQ